VRGVRASDSKAGADIPIEIWPEKARSIAMGCILSLYLGTNVVVRLGVMVLILRIGNLDRTGASAPAG
jgi:hypothetical protein